MSPLTDIFDVGDTRAAHLKALGLESVGDVASADLGMLTALDGVGRPRAAGIRHSARELVGTHPDTHEGRSAGDDRSTGRCARNEGDDRRERVTDRTVATEEVVVLVPGCLLATDVGRTDHRDPLDAGVVSLPGGVLDGEGVVPQTSEGVTDLAPEAAVVCFPASRLAVDAPTLYEAIADLDRDRSPGFPVEGFLGPSVTAIDGGTLPELREASPELESGLTTLLRYGTVFLDGRRFDFDNPHEVSVLASGGVYVPGDAALPEGALLAEGTVLREAAAVPDASLFDTGVVPVEGTDAVEDPHLDSALSPSVLRQSGVLLPPGSTRTEQ